MTLRRHNSHMMIGEARRKQVLLRSSRLLRARDTVMSATVAYSRRNMLRRCAAACEVAASKRLCQQHARRSASSRASKHGVVVTRHSRRDATVHAAPSAARRAERRVTRY